MTALPLPLRLLVSLLKVFVWPYAEDGVYGLRLINLGTLSFVDMLIASDDPAWGLTFFNFINFSNTGIVSFSTDRMRAIRKVQDPPVVLYPDRD
jgi:hypothetical protein